MSDLNVDIAKEDNIEDLVRSIVQPHVGTIQS